MLTIFQCFVTSSNILVFMEPIPITLELELLPIFFSISIVEVHPHVALFATRGKASPCLKEVFQPCFMVDSKEVFQPCFMADFKEQMFL